MLSISGSYKTKKQYFQMQKWNDFQPRIPIADKKSVKYKKRVKMFLDMQSLKFYLPHTLLSGSDWRMSCQQKRKTGIQEAEQQQQNKAKGNKAWREGLRNSQPSWGRGASGGTQENTETDEVSWWVCLGLGKENLGI